MSRFLKLSLILGIYVSLPIFAQYPNSKNALASEICKDCTRIGILPLKYDGDKNKKSFYIQGIQDSLIHALSSVDSLIVIDRARTNEVIKEIAFQQSAFVNEKTQVKVGEILGVEYLYTGSIQEVNGRLRIFIERISVATGEIKSITQVTGATQDLFDLQDQIAQKILGQTQINVTAQERQEVRQNIQVTSSLAAYEYFIRGVELQNNKSMNQAVIAYSKAIELDPRYAVAYYNRGLAYYDLKQYDKSIQDNNRAIELKPNYALAYNSRGLAYYNLKQYEKSLQDYNRALVLNPNSATAYISRGLAYNRLKQYDRAIKDFNWAIELDPNSALAYHNRGISHNYLQQYDKEIADYFRACQLGIESTCTYLKENGY
jgi:tetratricopeptide (TPR) repeat protein